MANLFAMREGEHMDISKKKIEEFEETLREIRFAVNQEADLFRTPDMRKAITGLSYGFSAAIAGLCIAGARVQAASPAGSGTAMVFVAAAFILAAVAGGILKAVLFTRIMAKRNRSLSSLLKIIYGTSVVSVIAGALVSILVLSLFFLRQGSGILIIPFSAIFMAFAVFGLTARIRLPEFMVLGWAMLCLSLVSLFFIAGSPWLWSGIVWGGSFLALAIAGSLFKSAS